MKILLLLVIAKMILCWPPILFTNSLERQMKCSPNYFTCSPGKANRRDAPSMVDGEPSLSHLKWANQMSSVPVEPGGNSTRLPFGARGDA